MTAASDAATCDIIIPIWNQLELTKRCLESVLASTEEPIRLILVDNGSQPPTRRALDQFQAESRLPTQIIRNDSNLGFIRASNQGLRCSRGPWVCLLNNDTIVTPGWLTEMLKVARSDPKIGLVNPTSNSLGFHPGKTPLADYAAGLKAESGRWTELSTALGFCLLARRSLFERIGFLDESFGMGNFDDDDLSRRARDEGLTCARACAAYVHHDEKASFRLLPGWKRDFEANRRRFEQRWGRRLRILWAPLPAPSSPAPIPVPQVLQLLEQGHWFCFVGPPEALPREIASHAQVSRLDATPLNWRRRALLRLLWKRKKPYDLVISQDPAWSGWVTRLKGLHRARLLEQPTAQEVLSQCRTLSRSASGPR